MSLEIIAFEDISVNSGKNGYQVAGLSSSLKYYGRLEAAVKAVGWDKAFAMVMEETYAKLVSSANDLFGRNKVTWESQGVAGTHVAKTYPRYTGVELELVSFTDHQLSKSDTVTTTIFPGNHGQAALRMIHFDIDAHCFNNGPFAKEGDLMEFIRQRAEQVLADMRNFEIYDVADTVEKDEDEDEVDADQAVTEPA
jgi:hypothetical protein